VLLRSRKGLNSKYKEPPTKVSASRTIATIGIDIGKNWLGSTGVGRLCSRRADKSQRASPICCRALWKI
jgi:hypothetical protein